MLTIKRMLAYTGVAGVFLTLFVVPTRASALCAYTGAVSILIIYVVISHLPERSLAVYARVFLLCSGIYLLCAYADAGLTRNRYLLTNVLFDMCEGYFPLHRPRYPLPPMVGIDGSIISIPEPAYNFTDLVVIWHSGWCLLLSELAAMVAVSARRLGSERPR